MSCRIHLKKSGYKPEPQCPAGRLFRKKEPDIMTVQEKRDSFKSQMMDSSRMKVLCGAFDGITARAAQAADFFDGCYMGGQLSLIHI